MPSTISALILAAGESKRMGKPKLLMRWGQGTVLEQTIDNFLNSKVNEVVVVAGYRAEEMTNLIASKPVTVAVNQAYRRGLSTSIVTGLGLVRDDTQAIMLSLADQPLVDSQTINRLIAAYSAKNKGIVLPVFRGRRGHPVIFSIKYKGELMRLKGDIGGRQIIGQHPDDILEVDVDCEGVIIDIDTEDSYQLHRVKGCLKQP